MTASHVIAPANGEIKLTIVAMIKTSARIPGPITNRHGFVGIDEMVASQRLSLVAARIAK